MNIKLVASTLTSYFQNQGIRVMRYDAYSTNSVYLKLDYGALYSIRISDHRGKKYLNYRFNVTKGYRGKKRVATKFGWQREYYALEPSDLNKMCRSIMQLRRHLIKYYGPYGYQAKMVSNLKNQKNTKGFWKQAKDYGLGEKQCE